MNTHHVPVNTQMSNTIHHNINAHTSHHYRCNYRDVKHYRRPEIEIVDAENIAVAFHLFVDHRHKEDWSIPQIYSHSLLEIIDEETGEKYVLNKFGEIVNRKTITPL